MKLHYNKPYNFVKGLTITEIITYAYIFMLSIIAFAGVFTVLVTAVINPGSFDSVGGIIK